MDELFGRFEFFLVVLWDELWVWSEVCIKYDCEEVLVEKLTVLC